MTGPREPPRASIWTIAPAAVAILMAAGDLGDRFWGSASDGKVTAFQVAQLTAAVRDLASKFDGLPKQSAIDAIMVRQDRAESAISALQQAAAALRADVDNVMHPQIRQPR